MSVIFSARSILIAYLTQSAQIHMNSCNTQNTHKMPPDQAWAMKSPTPQIQTQNTHTHTFYGRPNISDRFPSHFFRIQIFQLVSRFNKQHVVGVENKDFENQFNKQLLADSRILVVYVSLDGKWEFLQHLSR